MPGQITCHKICNPEHDQGRCCFAIFWEADDAGVVPGCIMTDMDAYLELVAVNPGVPAPDPFYDILLLDDQGVDVMDGRMTNLSTTNNEQFLPMIGTTESHRMIQGDLRFRVKQNNQAGAKGSCFIYFQE